MNPGPCGSRCARPQVSPRTVGSAAGSPSVDRSESNRSRISRARPSREWRARTSLRRGAPAFRGLGTARAPRDRRSVDDTRSFSNTCSHRALGWSASGDAARPIPRGRFPEKELLENRGAHPWSPGRHPVTSGGATGPGRPHLHPVHAFVSVPRSSVSGRRGDGSETVQNDTAPRHGTGPDPREQRHGLG